MKILIVVAMEAEAREIVSELQLQRIPSPFNDFPCRVYDGEIQDHMIKLISNGEYPDEPKVSLIGTEPGAVATKLAVDYFQPELVINLGTAGGRKSTGLEIGDVIIANKIFFHDRFVGIPGYKERAVGNFSTWERSEEVADKIGARFANMSSGNSFEMNDLDKARLDELSSQAKDMEVAAVAWVCSLNKTPILSMKSITDFIDVTDHSSEDQFFANLKKACENLAKKSKELLEAI